METLTLSASQPIIEPMTHWLTCKESSERTGYAPRYLQRLCREGKLKCSLKSGVYLIDPDDLDKYAAKMKSLGTAKHDWRHKEN